MKFPGEPLSLLLLGFNQLAAKAAQDLFRPLAFGDRIRELPIPEPLHFCPKIPTFQGRPAGG
jgi:hypothetical protein